MAIHLTVVELFHSGSRVMDRPNNWSTIHGIHKAMRLAFLKTCFALSLTVFCPCIRLLKNTIIGGANSGGQGDWESFTSSFPLLIFPLLRAGVCYAIKPSRSHVITTLSKWCQAVGLEWVMGVRSPSVVHDMTGAAGVQVKWTAFWQRAEELSMAAYLTTPAQKTTHVRGIVFAIERAFMSVEHHRICDWGVLRKSIWNRRPWFPPSCTNNVLWAIWNVFTLVAITACYDQFHFNFSLGSHAVIYCDQE